MPSLQIRDMPEDIYAAYKKCCAQDDRSMSQQTLRLIKIYLATKGFIDGTEVDKDDAPRSDAIACRISTPTATATLPRTGEAAWRDSIHNPMVDIIGREERIAKRKALFKRIDELNLGDIKLPPGYSSSADLIREDRDNDLGRSWVKEALA